MTADTRLKIILTISIISFSVVAIISYFFNLIVGVLIGLIADVIQISSWVYWLFEKEEAFEEVPEKVDSILTVVTKKEERSRTREKLMSRLVNEGVIADSELYKLIRKKEIILAFPYGESVVRSVIALSGSNRQPLAALLRELGFVKATRFQNVMVAFADDLPKELRSVNNLQSFLKSALRTRWIDLSEKVKREYPAERYEVKFAKWRSRAGFGAAYILMKSMARDFVIGSINRASFTPDFKEHIWSAIDQARLRRVIRKHRRRVREIMSKISIDFLLMNQSRKLRNLMTQHEDALKKEFRIKVFTDYRSVDPEELSKVIRQILPPRNKDLASTLASTIIQESQGCFDALEEMGIYLV